MTQTQIRARYGLGIWGLVLVGFSVVFFLGGGAVTYVDDSLRIGIAAVTLGIGFVGYFSMIYLTREKSKGVSLISDERDIDISRQANEIALVAMLVFVYVVCIILFLRYENLGSLPVGWMWFLAYTNACFGFLAQSAATLILHRKMNNDG